MGYESASDGREKKLSRAELVDELTSLRQQVVGLEKLLHEGDKQFNGVELSEAEKVARTKAQTGILLDIGKLREKISATEALLDEIEPQAENPSNETAWSDVSYRGGDNRSANN